MASENTGWNDLPFALQRKILEHRLLFGRPVAYERHGSIIRRALLPLALVNRQLCFQATQTYYESNTFIIAPKSYPPGGWHKNHKYVPYPGRAVGYLIRRLELHIPVGIWKSATSLDALLTTHHCYLCMLVIPNESHPHYWSEYTAWQRNFPNLDELKLVLVEYGSCNTTNHEPIHLPWLDDVHVHLKVKKVEVDVEGLCRRAVNQLGEPVENVHCPCAERVSKAFKRLLNKCEGDDDVHTLCPTILQEAYKGQQMDVGGEEMDQSPIPVNKGPSPLEMDMRPDERMSRFTKAYANYVQIRERSSRA